MCHLKILRRSIYSSITIIMSRENTFNLQISMTPTLYMITPSPAVRTVLITARAIGLNLNEKEMNLAAGDNLKPDFIKINPQHTIPTLVDDDGFAIWDSHVIITYLVSKYAKGDSLYPKDTKKRAVVNQRLYFELEVVFPLVFKIADPVIRSVKTTIDQEDKDKDNEIYGFLEAFLNDKQWIAGEFVTVADYSLIPSITSLHVLVPIDCQKYSKMSAWLKTVENLPEYEANKKGLAVFSDAIKNKLL